MLQALVMPIARSVTYFTNGLDAQQEYDGISMCREVSKAILQFMGPIMISKWFTWIGHANCIHTWIYPS